ncbi:MAG: TM1266 family iron-only hydrogenase system putative regulator [Bacillota bacterium]
MAETRTGVIAIVVENPGAVQEKLNSYISAAGHIIIGRMGVPYREKNESVIALLVDGTTDAINSLTGQLGTLPGVNVRSALTKEK